MHGSTSSPPPPPPPPPLIRRNLIFLGGPDEFLSIEYIFMDKFRKFVIRRFSCAISFLNIWDHFMQMHIQTHIQNPNTCVQPRTHQHRHTQTCTSIHPPTPMPGCMHIQNTHTHSHACSYAHIHACTYTLTCKHACIVNTYLHLHTLDIACISFLLCIDTVTSTLIM